MRRPLGALGAVMADWVTGMTVPATVNDAVRVVVPLFGAIVTDTVPDPVRATEPV